MSSIEINETIKSSTETDTITIQLKNYKYLKIRIKNETNNLSKIILLSKNELRQIIIATERWINEKER